MPVSRETGLGIVGRETETNRVIEQIKEYHVWPEFLDSTDPTCDPVPVVTRILREAVRTMTIQQEHETTPR